MVEIAAEKCDCTEGVSPNPRSAGRLASDLVAYGISRGLVDPLDSTWAYNSLLEAVEPVPLLWRVAPTSTSRRPISGLPRSPSRTVSSEDSANGRDRAAMRVMGVLTRPSEVAGHFDLLASEQSPVAATDYLYALSCDVGYVRRAAIARNVEWSTPTRWRPRDRDQPLGGGPARHRTRGSSADGDVYPACQLCIENEAYSGRAASAAGGAHPARRDLRIVPIELEGERWGFQYSPYAYFNEHCIAMSAEHPAHARGREEHGLSSRPRHRVPALLLRLERRPADRRRVDSLTTTTSRADVTSSR